MVSLWTKDTCIIHKDRKLFLRLEEKRRCGDFVMRRRHYFLPKFHHLKRTACWSLVWASRSFKIICELVTSPSGTNVDSTMDWCNDIYFFPSLVTRIELSRRDYEKTRSPLPDACYYEKRCARIITSEDGVKPTKTTHPNENLRLTIVLRPAAKLSQDFRTSSRRTYCIASAHNFTLIPREEVSLLRH